MSMAGCGRWSGCGFVSCLVAVVLLGASPERLCADAFDGYALVGTVDLPVGAGPFTVTPDGRIITLVADELFVESGVGSGVFSSLGVLPGADIPFFGAAFIAVSPDGSRVAVGDNGGSSYVDYRVGVFELSALTGVWFSANHFLGVWIDNTHILLAASDFTNGSAVTVLDTNSVDPNDPTNPVVVENIGGASGGIAFDVGGNLFVGNGFTSIGPSDTGVIKAFDATDWQAALSGDPALDFEVQGTLIIDILNATPLGFDHEGNLFTGGGSATDSDFLAIVRASAVVAALGGGGAVDPADSSSVRRLDPISDDVGSWYDGAFNPISRTLYLRNYGDRRLYAYRDLTGVPAVSTWGLVVMTLLLSTAATLMAGGRYHRESVASC